MRLQNIVKHKLEAALVKIAGANQVARWDAQAAGESKPLHASSSEMTLDEGEQAGLGAKPDPLEFAEILAVIGRVRRAVNNCKA